MGACFDLQDFRKIELDDRSHRYFQIIDDTGLYISDSGNVNSFAEDLNIWKELERYEIADGITVEQMVQEQRMEEIRVKSQTDSLTGLYNREYFVRECVRCIKDGKHLADGKVSALFLLDLDHFKLANDTLGHMTGDQILKECGRKLRIVIRETDLAGRLAEMNLYCLSKM